MSNLEEKIIQHFKTFVDSSTKIVTIKKAVDSIDRYYVTRNIARYLLEDGTFYTAATHKGLTIITYL